MNTEPKNQSMPTFYHDSYILLTRYFKFENGEQDISSFMFKLDKKIIIKDTIMRWKELFGEQEDFLITYQVISIWDGEKKPFLFREDANEQTINELLK